jgi:hypothetical protein
MTKSISAGLGAFEAKGAWHLLILLENLGQGTHQSVGAMHSLCAFYAFSGAGIAGTICLNQQ